MKLVDGHKIAKRIKDKIVKEIIEENGANTKEVSADKRPNLAIILVGDRQDSQLYVELKEKEAKKVGIDTHLYKLSKEVEEEKVKEVIKHLNEDPQIDGILLQLPLPKHLNTEDIVATIDPGKDVDRFHSENLKTLKETCNHEHVMPPLFQVVLEVLREADFDLKENRVCVLANSKVLGSALKTVLECKGAQVNIVGPYEEKLTEKTGEADLLITAIGRPHFVKKEMIKKGAGIIDIGITKEGKYVLGDVDQEDVAEKADFLTPVPGGVGPITIAAALKNTLKLFKEKK